MADSYTGEIRMFAGNYAPVGWMFCDGQLLSIAENSVLYSLIGTTYGGDGVNTFALPDLRGRAPVHQGNYQGSSFTIGQAGGTETVALTINQLPAHSHSFLTQTKQGNTSNPSQASPAMSSLAFYTEAAPAPAVNGQMMAGAISPAGGSQSHNNMMPYVGIHFIISLNGIFPPRS
ncbi:phage tail protein [Paenibacillus protaetiae]|uniref:Phage tail protein n=1 Tax=Paenibacillus protaetiae TaxID=2509456 RepID=A0A4P6F1Z3_9BACL|nr:tail fiber protein [Paenibacillus protaetiae]QAY67087.1 phage tail protein [Paenibacillus protaetiae]